MFIIGGPDSYESKKKLKLEAWDFYIVEPNTLEFLLWYEVLITLVELAI
jgi:hypothetical protein